MYKKAGIKQGFDSTAFDLAQAAQVECTIKCLYDYSRPTTPGVSERHTECNFELVVSCQITGLSPCVSIFCPIRG